MIIDLWLSQSKEYREITLEFNIFPMAKQSMRSAVVQMPYGKSYARHYQSKKVTDYEKQIYWIAKSQLPKDFKMYEKYIHILELEYRFPVPKCKRTEFNRNNGMMFMNQKPDLTDNISKGFVDGLKGLVWSDDCRIVTMNNVAKIYSEKIGITVRMVGV